MKNDFRVSRRGDGVYARGTFGTNGHSTTELRRVCMKTAKSS